MSVTKAAAAFVVGAAAMFAIHPAHAQSAYDACEDVMAGQRSFCMIQAQEEEAAAKARKNKKDVTIHYDYDDTNDTPAQTKAKQTYQSAAAKCYDVQPGQRGFCMDEARLKYNQEMGW